ncbi:hypothetical protein [Membranihabitans maritimus]|uniref:hypothetical protein n=1 Tax=Membranihabitans maritimus TaxID=2904244 RepID=UPI001F161A06|nr:hypothetical protein [Membranihabitans maritimus]
MIALKPKSFLPLLFFFFLTGPLVAQTSPDQIKFVRKGVKRLIFDNNQSIPLAQLDPGNSIGFQSMHPTNIYSSDHPNISISNNTLNISSNSRTSSGIWIGGFNPFATYTIDLESTNGNGEIGFEFSAPDNSKKAIITVSYDESGFKNATLHIGNQSIDSSNQVVSTISGKNVPTADSKIILQMLGSGFVLYHRDSGLPQVIGQGSFTPYIDLREKEYTNSFQSRLYTKILNGNVLINKVSMDLTTGVGLADIRAITYEDGSPFLDRNRLWHTMSIRGRALPHHIQGVFSMDPTVFDIQLEGIIVFDRNDGLLRNEIASHIFYDRNEEVWRGITTGFSAFANPEEEKQLLAVESERDPRFGFSIMKADTFGIIGDIEDPHIIFDEEVSKWRILTCVNEDGYKAILLESDFWNRKYKKIAGPVSHNSTGTSIQKIGSQRYCFSGSSEREIFVYTYPDLRESGILQMDLPPWADDSGSRVWPNVVQLPEEYPFRYVALMMDRYNFPGMQGPNWTYGAIYLYHGYTD